MNTNQAYIGLGGYLRFFPFAATTLYDARERWNREWANEEGKSKDPINILRKAHTHEHIQSVAHI